MPITSQSCKACIPHSFTTRCHYDKRTGFKTKQVLTYPVVADNKYLMGVIQLLNKKSGGRFTTKRRRDRRGDCKSLGIAFYNLRKISKKPPTKFDLLVANGKISQNDLDNAVAESKKGAADIESLLIEKYKIPKARPRQVARTISQVPLHRV